MFKRRIVRGHTYRKICTLISVLPFSKTGLKFSEINITINDSMFKSTWKIKKWEVLWNYKNFSHSSFIMRVVDFRFD